MEAEAQPTRRQPISRWTLPLWLTYALLLLGINFVVSMPLGVGDDVGWRVLSIVLAFGVGWFLNRKVYKLTVLESSERGWLMRLERRRYKGRGQRAGWE